MPYYVHIVLSGAFMPQRYSDSYLNFVRGSLVLDSPGSTAVGIGAVRRPTVPWRSSFAFSVSPEVLHVSGSAPRGPGPVSPLSPPSYENVPGRIIKVSTLFNCGLPHCFLVVTIQCDDRAHLVST